MSILCKKWALLAIVFVFKVSFSGEGENSTIAEYFRLPDSRNDYCKISVEIIDKIGRKKYRVMKMYTRATPDGRDSYIEVLEPTDVSGVKFLITAQGDQDDVQRLYLPSLAKVRRIASSSKGGKFMNSDFYYYDLEDRHIKEFSYKYLEEKSLDGKTYVLFDVTPINHTSPYSRQVWWINNADNYVYQRDCYHAKNAEKLEKTIFVEDIKNVDGILIEKKMKVNNFIDGSTTLMAREDISINTAYDENVFSVNELKK